MNEKHTESGKTANNDRKKLTCIKKYICAKQFIIKDKDL